MSRLRATIHPGPLSLLHNPVIDRHGMTTVKHQLANLPVRGKHDPLVHRDLPDRKNHIRDPGLAWAALLAGATGGAQPEVGVMQHVCSRACILDDLSRDY